MFVCFAKQRRLIVYCAPPPSSTSCPQQEVIVQNFRAKQGTAMAGAVEPPLAELLWTVAVDRLLLGPDVRGEARGGRRGGAGCWPGMRHVRADHGRNQGSALLQGTSTSHVRLHHR